MKVFYCAFENIFNPVVDSQIITLLKKIIKRLNNKDQQIYLVLFNSLNNIFKKNFYIKKQIIKESLNSNCFFSFKFPYFFKFPRFLRSMLFINSIICLFEFIFIIRIKKNEKVLFHCRTDIGSYILLKVKRFYYKNIKIICDCRGIGSKEIFYESKARNKFELSKRILEIEKFAQSNADYVFCVSENFKNYIINNNKTVIKKINVIPCCVDTEDFKYVSKLRLEVRSEMDIADRFVILFSGSLNGWQLPERMIEIFKIFKDIIQESIFVIFTKDINYANNLLLNSGLKSSDYIISSKPYDLINKYLLIGDLSLLIRENNDVNNIAFPIKFAEYIRCGIPVLTSIKSDVADFIHKYNAGYYLKDFKSDDEVKRIAEKVNKDKELIKSDYYKDKISNLIGEKLGWDYHIDNIIGIYKELLNIK